MTPTQKTAVIIQARMGSTRLPGKVLHTIGSHSLLGIMLQRIRHMQTVDTVIVATTTNLEDTAIVDCAAQHGALTYQGSEHDVLARVLNAAQQHNIGLIIEMTADCPFIDPWESDRVVHAYHDGNYDYASNVLTRTYPRGMDTQVFSTNTLQHVSTCTTHPVDREHVSYYIYQHPEQFKLGNVSAPPQLTRPELRLTVDTPEDLTVIQHITTHFGEKITSTPLREILQYLDANPEVARLNQHVEQTHVHY